MGIKSRQAKEPFVEAIAKRHQRGDWFLPKDTSVAIGFVQEAEDPWATQTD